MTKSNTKIEIKTKTDEVRHDLKNKLTVIQGYAELLITKLKSEKEKKWAQEIVNNSQDLYKLIDDKVR